MARILKIGIRCPLVIDGANWGQDIGILQVNSLYLLQKNPLKNLLFSVHMWWTASNGATKHIKNEIKESVDHGLPLIVGEFAPMGVGCARSIDYKTILEECQKYDIGWMSWSWGLVDNGDCKLMDMTSDAQKGKFECLADWGKEVAVTDRYSIRNTAQKTAYM